MRVWDISPGYLNRQSLLGEHRELHGIVSILSNERQGYSRHPETLRWVGHGWALRMRHRQLAFEMALRGYHDRSPVELGDNPGAWPGEYIDLPHRQFALLEGKYRDREPGRIPLPRSAQQLWSQHKYSIMARNVRLCREIGALVAAMSAKDDYSALARQLCEQLRLAPSPGGVRNALEHMWGYVAGGFGGDVSGWASGRLLQEVQLRAREADVVYLVSSTALGELGAWLPASQGRFHGAVR